MKPWVDIDDRRLTDAWRNGWKLHEIARLLGRTSDSVKTRARRLDLPTREYPLGGSPYRVVDQHALTRNELAELMANGCPSVSEAARRLGVTQQHADGHWQAIRRGLGPQAC